MKDIERLRIAFKKLKATIFFDKTQLPMRDSLVLYENEMIDDKLFGLEQALFHGIKWEETEQEILDSIGVLIYPKSMKAVDDQTAIFNSDSIPIEMDRPQYFIDLSPAGHILGTLWVLEYGVKLDQNAGETDGNEGMYQHSYGNRLRKNLINPETGDYTYAPGLFEPYFSQYESWRDTALEHAEKRLNDKQDALILTLDFKIFFYSVDIQSEWFDHFVSDYDVQEEWKIRLNRFVFKVIERYSQELRSIHTDSEILSLSNRNVLPIGFLPSNILSNVVLTPFDNVVIDKLNPVYYGRYVDDIIIVDKVEANDMIYKLAREKSSDNRLNVDTVLHRFLCDNFEILEPDLADNCENKGNSYHILDSLLNCGDSKVTVQNEKVKLFYFQSGATKALLNCFRSRIKNNVSEFRFLPNLDSVMEYRNYTELFQIKNNDSINKLRGVTGIELDKFSLAKFLGKYRKVGGMIQSKEEDAFAEDALLIFDERVLVDNYTTWERLFEIFIVNNRLDIVEKLAVRIVSAIDRYEAKLGTEDYSESIPTHDALLRTFHSALCRTTALVWGEQSEKLIDKVTRVIIETFSPNKHCDNRFKKESLESFQPRKMKLFRKAYCKHRMVNKYVIPLPIDCVLDRCFDENQEVNLCQFADCSRLASQDWWEQESHYRYYPYIFLPQDISFAIEYGKIANGQPLLSPHTLLELVKELFLSLNYPLCDEESLVYGLKDILDGPIKGLSDSCSDKKYNGTYIGTSKEQNLNKLRVAVGNVELKKQNILSALDGKPAREYKRYSELRKVINEAIENHIDMLVLPEAYVPFEWLPSLSRVCANNQLALITGVEHVVSGAGDDNSKAGFVYNLTAVILPYKQDDYNFAYVSFHNKVYYSPKELSLIHGYHHKEITGNTYHLYCWRDVWFSVYCCYELTSIHDRAVFQNYADLIIAVEWNSDVPYFGTVVESLVRDLHCYCIQANSSDYGDSRLLQPTQTEIRDAIKTKGGKNPCVLFDEIDIKALRDFQAKSVDLQKKDGPFKQTPPGLNRSILAKKRSGTLKEDIEK